LPEFRPSARGGSVSFPYLCTLNFKADFYESEEKKKGDCGGRFGGRFLLAGNVWRI
jgi:hypothetical protein